MSNSKMSIESVPVSSFMSSNVYWKYSYTKSYLESHDEKELDSTTNKETPIGILTERDIARMVGFSANFYEDISVSEIMSKPLITATPNTTVKDATALMEQKNIRRLPVVNNAGQLVGIITARDIFNAVMNIFREILRDQNLMSLAF